MRYVVGIALSGFFVVAALLADARVGNTEATSATTGSLDVSVAR